MTAPTDTSRRPIASRGTAWARWAAAKLAASSITPNQISVASVVWAALGGGLIAWGSGWPAWLAAAGCVQLRLLCNLFDGMVAVEGGKGSPAGPLYNEFPDRVSDTLFLVPLGYAAGLPWLGWLAALLAMATAYVRAFGGALGLSQDFSGVMAKQRRMAATTLGLLAQSAESAFSASHVSFVVALAIIAAGSLLTCITRTRTIARSLAS